MAVQFPAFCPNCGFIFESRLISISGSATNLTLTGNKETCPRCGAWAELPDGTFDVVGDTIHILSASQLTHERLRRLAAILDTARRGGMTEEAAARAISEEAPSLRPLLERLRPRMRQALIVFLWAVVQILIAQGVQELRDDSATRDDVQRAVEQAVEQCQEQVP